MKKLFTVIFILCIAHGLWAADSATFTYFILAMGGADYTIVGMEPDHGETYTGVMHFNQDENENLVATREVDGEMIPCSIEWSYPKGDYFIDLTVTFTRNNRVYEIYYTVIYDSWNSSISFIGNVTPADGEFESPGFESLHMDFY